MTRRLTYAEAWETTMPRNRMPGHGGPGNERPLLNKAARFALKRWVANKLEKGAQMSNPFKLPDKPLAKSMTIIVIVAYVLGTVLVKLSEALASGDWSALTGWLMSEEFWGMMAQAGVVFGIRRAVGFSGPGAP